MKKQKHDPAPPAVPDNKRAPALLHELLDVAYANGVWSGGKIELYRASVVGTRYVARTGGPGCGRSVATAWTVGERCEAPWEIAAYVGTPVDIEFRTWEEP